ncbi:MAG: TetR/AcrR family transcriptional regulator [Proteobacteria bacterium]|nr:TetR/AcrR family transcriptional regulator [Pseudomonadota bacterium]MBU1639722.1 TetR/AcrR family transcriptional regulator [Pseudomonadota bacterium]
MSEPDTKAKILKTAEELFAIDGFHHTSLRKITTKAGVNLAAVNYHFGSKESLLGAIFDRHLGPLNEIRIKRMEAVAALAEKSGERPGVEEVLRCFTEPTLALLHSDASTGYFRMLVGRSLSDPDPTVRQLFLQRVRDVLELLVDLLCQALPHRSRESVAWKLQFSLGAMSQTLTFQNHGPILGSLAKDKSIDDVIEMLTEFIVKGMEG